ncbi:hypothetical protein [Krasilnikovia sp. M28-CT-15]|uniref:hypothetical protein n=1 Tax=Krasilnikovia sp. M28-CT-15 TaxID=3373540 RepID=UPI00399C70AB
MLDRVVRWLNTQQQSLGRAVESYGINQRHALIAETAFLMASSSYNTGQMLDGDYEGAARQALAGLPRSDFASEALTISERGEAVKVSSKILRFLSGKSDIEFAPTVPGCGVIPHAHCDIRVATDLVEVKAVTRPFRGTDLRQLITYATMYYAKGRRMDNLTLLNPRRARYVTMSLDTITQGASGRPSVEVMQDLVEAMVGLQVSA